MDFGAGRIYNVKIAVKNLRDSIAFHDKILSFLGFKGWLYQNDPIDRCDTYVMGNGQIFLEFVEMPGLVPDTDTTTMAGPRIEFRAKDKDEVDRFYQHLLKNRANILCPPSYLFQEILDYSKGDFWYGTYFADLNGSKFGLVCTPYPEIGTPHKEQ